MAFRLSVNPPAIIRIRSDRGGKGKARVLYVTLPVNHPPHLLPHELHHVKQWWVTTAVCGSVLGGLAHFVPAVPYEVAGLSVGVFGALYFTSKSFRFWAEVGAYRVSASVQPKRIGAFAKMLYEYNTGHTLAQCRKAIEESKK